MFSFCGGRKSIFRKKIRELGIVKLKGRRVIVEKEENLNNHLNCT